MERQKRQEILRKNPTDALAREEELLRQIEQERALTMEKNRKERAEAKRKAREEALEAEKMFEKENEDRMRRANNGDDDASLSVSTTELVTMNGKTKRRRRVVFRSFCWERNSRLLVGADDGSAVIFDGSEAQILS